MSGWDADDRLRDWLMACVGALGAALLVYGLVIL